MTETSTSTTPLPACHSRDRVTMKDWTGSRSDYRGRRIEPMSMGQPGRPGCAPAFEVVKRRIDRLRYPGHRLHYVKGMVEETIPKTTPEKIALLRLDTDLYSSTKHELNYLYPRLTSGGILIIDDYGSIPGARHAVDEYA